MKNIKKIYKSGTGLLTLALLFASNSSKAQTCAVIPSCDQLGYDRTLSECASSALPCPFDKTKYFCLTTDELNEIAGKGVCDNPNVGDILYSDMSCSTELVSGKTPIGIIFNTTFRLAIALNESEPVPAGYGIEFGNGNSGGIAHVCANIDYDTTSGFDGFWLSSHVGGDWSGKINTKQLIMANEERNLNDSYIGFDINFDCPWLDYISAYSTVGTKPGEWYIPAISELDDIYKKKEQLNQKLTKVGGKILSDNSYWTSSLGSTNFIPIDFSSGQRFPPSCCETLDSDSLEKDLIRPVLAF